MDYNNYQPRKRLPYAVRMRNRIIVFAVFMGICALMGTCIFGEKEAPKPAEDTDEYVEEQDSSAASTDALQANKLSETEFFAKADSEDIANMQASVAAAVAPTEMPPEVEVIDSTHIKAQADVFMAEKIDNLLRRFRPEHAIILMVDTK